MHLSELRIYSQTRESLLLPRISVIDAQVEPLRVLKVFVEGLAAGEPSGIWLKPLRGVPSVPRMAPFDLVFLDEQGRVLRRVELAPAEAFPRPEVNVASALILPWRSLASSQMQPGDVVAMRPVQENETVLNRALVDESLKTHLDYSHPGNTTLKWSTPMKLVEPEVTAGSRSVLFRRVPQPRIDSPNSITVGTGEAISAQGPARIAVQPRPQQLSKPKTRRPHQLQRAAELAFDATRSSISTARKSASQWFAALNRLWFKFRARDFQPGRGLRRRSPCIFEECS